MSNYIFIILSIMSSVILNTGSQTLLKIGSSQNPVNIYIFGGLMGYGLSTIFYILVLGKLNLSIAYPIVIGLTVITTTLSGVIILREQVPITHWIGIGLILSGVSAIAIHKVS